MDDSTAKVLEAIGEVRDEARENNRLIHLRADKQDERIDRHEEKLSAVAATVSNLGSTVARHESQIASLAESQVSVAKSAALAAELAAQALAKVNTASDETRKMVESAMTIQKGAIAAEVIQVVAPVVAKLDVLEANDEAQAKTNVALTTTLKNQDEMMSAAMALLAKLAKWESHWAVKVLLVLAATIGAAVGGYIATGRH